jgi:UDP-N-acetylmuramoyl-L-alanyl-D-glutamate--2,6-diaminopimelate ligase
MQLSTLLGSLDVPVPLTADPQITSIGADSRAISPGDMFIAIRGYTTDGHKYIPDALARGAAAIVLEDEAYIPAGDLAVPVVRVDSSRRAAAVLADAFYGHPSRALTLVGVTGTNGKTTVSLMLDSIFRAGAKRTGVIGTLGRFVAGAWRDADRTTPDAIELQKLLAEMRDSGITHVSMEVSSHALDLDRVLMCSFAGGIFTNLTQDHLDWHADIEAYLAAKTRLFTEYADGFGSRRPMIGAINIDDPMGVRIAEAARCKVIRYGTNGGSDVRARSISASPDGVQFDLLLGRTVRPVKLHLTGLFNVYNALAAAACCHGLGIGVEAIVEGLESLEAVPGRFERVSQGQPYAVIVDYAHTPDALENVLRAARALSPRRVLCVMGCGGDRDRGKRPKMGKIAAEMADFTVITSDNSRTESVDRIVEDIRGGVSSGEVVVETDRRAAIFRAVGMCEPGDLLIIAGKGHETYQEFDGYRTDFDDRSVAREAIAARSS